MKVKYKYCPFCGGMEFREIDYDGEEDGILIGCETCGAQAPRGVWNRRYTVKFIEQ